jgi:hypothetical protein
MRFCLPILSILAVLLSGGNMEINSVKIVTEGKPNARIIIEENPTVSANLAALELQYFVEKMTGVKLQFSYGIITVTQKKEPLSGSRSLGRISLPTQLINWQRCMLKMAYAGYFCADMGSSLTSTSL